jgi:hypothetical protein
VRRIISMSGATLRANPKAVLCFNELSVESDLPLKEMV